MSFATFIFSFAIISAIVAARAFSVAPFVEKLSDTTFAAAAVAEIVSQIVRGSAKLGHDLL